MQSVYSKNNSKSDVMVDGNISDPFQFTAGLLQGDALAPFLFFILINYLMTKATEDTDSFVVTHPRQSILLMTLPCWSHVSLLHCLNLREQLLQQNNLVSSSLVSRPSTRPLGLTAILNHHCKFIDNQ